MSKQARNKKARLKVAKTSQSRQLETNEDVMRANIMKFAEQMYEFDDEGYVIKKKFDIRGIEIPEEEDPEIDPESLKEKPEKKIKIEKQLKKSTTTNKGIDFGDLLKNPD